jgi:tetratricopeptide (TPR) repeat protein
MATVSDFLRIAREHYQAGRVPEAAAAYRQAIAADERCAQAWHNLGILAVHNGRNDEAVRCALRVVELDPRNAEAHYALGFALAQQRQRDAAVASYRTAVQLKPDFAIAYNNLGDALEELGQHEEALESYRRALKLNPGLAEVHYNCGGVLFELQKFDEAIASYRQALAIRANFPEALSNLGNVHNKIGNPDEAAACYSRAIELAPNHADAHNNLGNALKELGRYDEAEQCYRRAIALAPELLDPHTNLAQLRLLLGDLPNGFRDYELRLKSGTLRSRPFEQPPWRGEPLSGKTILVQTEQGFGDAIQFIRYTRLLKQQGADVLAECQQPLVKILATCPAIDALFGYDAPLPSFDYHVSLLSLPHLCGTTIETIPADIPYLFADPVLVAHWKEQLATLTGFRIGMNWHGRAGVGSFRRRDIPLDYFAALAALPNVHLISLQREDADALRNSPLQFPLWIPPGEIDAAHGAFMDTAAIMLNLDVVISSDTSIAHLAGALGVPVWTPLPFVADWRWLLDRCDTPWYPKMRLFRQQKRGDWADVFDRLTDAVRQELRDWSASR